MLNCHSTVRDGKKRNRILRHITASFRRLYQCQSKIFFIHYWVRSRSIIGFPWMKGYNPDLIFASVSIANMCKKSVMDPIPHTQHRPICVSVQPVVVPQPTPFRRLFNFRKADWNGYSTELDNSIEDVESIPFCREFTCGFQKTYTKRM